jgi:cobyrinic acid a,c-diamide synthase
MSGAVIAGTHSGCGKTTITLGIMAALKRKGLKVQPFKTGPDFIDAGLHKLITGVSSRNLDLWMCGEEYVTNCFHKYSQDADIAIVEGVMGLYDGGLNTARLASILGLPVILVVDAYGMAESAGAVVKGFSDYGMRNTESAIAGVIFNRVASGKHYERLKNSVQDVEVLGYIPRDLNFEIPHRHLGLAVAEENPIAQENIERLADAALRHIDIDAILVMDECLSLHSRNEGDCPGFTGEAVESGQSPTSAIKIAVAYDRAFCFYYEDNLDLLKNAGAEIIKFSPLLDNKIPGNVDAVYIGGGYPELYAGELSKNISMLRSIKDWSDAGKPLYAECGGLMYLSKGIYDFDNKFFSMADILPFETQMKNGRPSLGYREIELSEDCILGKKGDMLRGHEFHYSGIKGTVPDLRTGSSKSLGGVVESGLSLSAYSTKNNRGEPVAASGCKHKNTLASYVHLHFGSNPRIAGNFLKFIKEN